MKKILTLSLLFLVIFFLSACSSNYPRNYKESSSYQEYGCTEDCSGHNAGWEWAEEKGISDPSDCGGKSQSFIEGCQSYAENY